MNGKWIVKSGTDFRDLSLIEMELAGPGVSQVNKIERFEINSRVPEDAGLVQVVKYYMEQGEEGLDRVLGFMNIDLDGRFSIVRSRESNLGNFICDIILEVCNQYRYITTKSIDSNS